MTLAVLATAPVDSKRVGDWVRVMAPSIGVWRRRVVAQEAACVAYSYVEARTR